MVHEPQLAAPDARRAGQTLNVFAPHIPADARSAIGGVQDPVHRARARQAAHREFERLSRPLSARSERREKYPRGEPTVARAGVARRPTFLTLEAGGGKHFPQEHEV